MGVLFDTCYLTRVMGHCSSAGIIQSSTHHTKHTVIVAGLLVSPSLRLRNVSFGLRHVSFGGSPAWPAALRALRVLSAGHAVLAALDQLLQARPYCQY
jgi:hypothetical protein